MDDVEIVKAQPEDAKELTRIALAAKQYWGYPENWMLHWQKILTVSPGCIAQNRVYKVVRGERIVGFYVLIRTAARLQLEHMFIQPEEIGKGIGRRLMEHAIRQAAGSEHSVMEIESDPNAEGFYLKMGARRVGARIYHLEGSQRMLPLLYLDVPRALEKLDAQGRLEK